MPIYKYQLFDLHFQRYVKDKLEIVVWSTEEEAIEAFINMEQYRSKISAKPLAERYELHRIKIGEIQTLE